MNNDINNAMYMYFQDEFAVPSGRVKQRNDRNDEATSEEYVNEKLSKQILTQARLQMQDLQRESDGSGNAVVSKKLPKLGDNMDSDEEDDGEGMFYTTLAILKLRTTTRRTAGVFFYNSNFKKNRGSIKGEDRNNTYLIRSHYVRNFFQHQSMSD